MIDYWQLLLLATLAGFTIFLGLPIAFLQILSQKKKDFLNAFALGILVFIIIDVIGHAWATAEEAASDTFRGKSTILNAVLSISSMFGGLGIGLLGLTWYESKYMDRFDKFQQRFGVRKNDVQISSTEHSQESRRQRQQLLHDTDAYKVSMMIAIGIGFHNFSEGLAIGQSYVSGAISLAVLLIIGFGAHNATEGFGIAGPFAGFANKPRIGFLILVGFIGGAPTFVGTLLGSLWISSLASILFLSIAGGALIYVTLLMYNLARKQTTNSTVMTGVLIGLFTGFVTDLMISLSGG